MLDEIFEMFERDRSKSAARKGGLRGRLLTLLDGDDRQSVQPTASNADRRRRESNGRDDEDDTTPDSDHDLYGDVRPSGRRRKRDADFFDFGD